MKTLVHLCRIITLVFLTCPCLGQDLTPFCYIQQTGGTFSGSIVGEKDNKFYVLTVAHGPKTDRAQVNIAIEGDKGFVGLPGKFIHKDAENDIALIEVDNFINIKVKPLELSDKIPGKDEKLLVPGFTFESDLIVKTMVFQDDILSRSTNNNFLVTCKGVGLSGMSGAPLLYKGSIVGVQSCSYNGFTRFCHPKIIGQNYSKYFKD